MAEWAEARPLRMGAKGRTCRDLWDAAPRGDWLLGYAEKAGAPRPVLVRAAAACARPALRFVPEGEDRPRLAVEAAEAWADEPTEGTMRRVEKAAHAAWEAGVAAAGTTGVGAAAEAARWVAMATDGKTWAGEAAWRAAGAHRQAEGHKSRDAAHAACADEVRRIIPFIDLAGGGP